MMPANTSGCPRPWLMATHSTGRSAIEKSNGPNQRTKDLTRAVHAAQLSNMSIGLRLFRACHHLLLGLLIVAGLTGCAHFPGVIKASEVRKLHVALASLSPTVRDVEAGRVAECAYDYSRVLARKYRVVRPAILHNCLVNVGFKQRGLCYQWAEDLLAQLQTMNLDSLELHWGIARVDTAREHNSVVVTARGQRFEQGIILDPWRRSGRLVWSPVSADKYPWVEGALTNSPAVVPP